MSNAGQGVTALIGGIIGFVVGGPTGAAYGFQLGLLAGTALFPTELPRIIGPRIEDLQTTSAQVGSPVVDTWGTIAVPGTVLWLGPLVEHAETEEVGGKGAPSQETTTFTYTQSIAVGLCEGVIGGLLRVWENGKLVYDLRDQQEDETDDAYQERLTASYAFQFTLYTGTDSQAPDPTIEAVEGVGTVPAFRDLAYVVFTDRLLTDEQARRHPQWRFEVFDGTSDRNYLDPTYLPGDENGFGSGAEDNELVVDWTHDRYYAWDLAQATKGFRVFRISDNTEIAQVLLDDILSDFGGYSGLGTGSTIVGFQGHLYFTAFTGLDTVATVKVNPATFGVEAQRPEGGAPETWVYGVALPVPSVDGAFDVLLTCSLVGDDFSLYDGRDLGGSVFWSPSGPNLDGRVCRGRVTANGRRYGYAMVVAGALSGASGPILIREVSAWVDPFFLLLDLDTSAPEMEIHPADVDPSWTRFSQFSGFWFDEGDNRLVIGVRGGGAASSPTETRLFKFDPSSQEIVWVTDTSIESTDQSGVHSRIQNYRLALLTGGVFNTRYFDTRTGEYEDVDWSDFMDATVITHTSFDGGSNRMIAYEFFKGFTVLEFGNASPEDVSLATIVETVTDDLGYLPGEIDVTDLQTIFVHGYARPRPMPGRSVIEPLRMVGFFDVVESEGRLTFPTRGKAIVATVDATDLGAHDESDQAPPDITTRKLTDMELPRAIRVHYIAPSRDYEPGEQISPTRITTDAVNDTDVDLATALDDNQAARIAEVIWADAWRARWVHSIVVDRYWSPLQPADAIAVPVDGRLERMRITSLEDHDTSLIRRLDLVRDDDGAYESTRVADPPERAPSVLRYLAATELLLLDLPPLREQDDDAGIYAAAARSGIGTTWAGAVIYRSLDGFTYAPIGSVASEATVGRVDEVLPAGISSTWDDANELEVVLSRGSLESRTESDLLNVHVNTAAIGVHGRWEIIQFLNAEEIGSGRWRLTGLLRGRRGTEHFIGTSQENDRFVLVSGPGIIRLPLDTSQIGDELQYRGVTAGATFSSGATQSFTGNALALETFSPVNISGERDDISDDLTISWNRRDRLFETLQDGVELPNSEASESYEIDILDGSSVVRTLTSATPSVVYTAAQQAADWGSPLPAAIEVHVYQMSAIVGRGTPGVATV